MFLLFSLFLLGTSSDYQIAISGEWTEVPYISDFVAESKVATYTLYLKQDYVDNYVDYISGILTFKDKQQNQYMIKPIDVCGYHYTVQGRFILLGSWSNEKLNSTCSNMSYFLDIFKKNLSNSLIFEEQRTVENSKMNSFRRFIMNFKKYINFTDHNQLNLHYSIEGIFTSIALSYKFSGIFLNISTLKAEYTIYGVVISILLIFSHYMWRSIHKLPPSLLQRNSISILSIVLICSFDASIINSLTDKYVTQLCPPNLKYFLIVCYLLLFLIEIMPEMIRLVIAIPKEKRTTSALLYTLFGLLSIFICCRLIISFSFLPLLFTAGPWFAQVILNAVSGFNANPGFKTLAFFSISRAIYFGYSFLYTNSIFNAYSIPKYTFVIIILVTQLIILPNQSYISSFLLSKKKPKYSKRDPPEGAICPICLLPVTMGDPITTPCNHSLHLNCLKRWLEQKYTCPVCRSELPELPLTMK